MNEALKPCPFCGSEAEGDVFGGKNREGTDPGYLIDCTNEDCFLGVYMRGGKKPWANFDDAAKAWNTRAALSHTAQAGTEGEAYIRAFAAGPEFTDDKGAAAIVDHLNKRHGRDYGCGETDNAAAWRWVEETPYAESLFDVKQFTPMQALTWIYYNLVRKSPPAHGDACINIIRRALTQAPACPEGWKMVPVEPTPAMFHAWQRAYIKAPTGSGVALAWNDGYTAMLAAAPAPSDEGAGG